MRSYKPRIQFLEYPASIIQKPALPGSAFGWAQSIPKVLTEPWMTEDITLPLSITDHEPRQWRQCRLLQGPRIQPFLAGQRQHILLRERPKSTSKHVE